MIPAVKNLVATVAQSSSIAGFAVSTLIKALGGLFILKMIALRLGPTAFGQLGQLMTLVAITSNFAGGGVTNALIQALSSDDATAPRQRKLGAALKIFIVTSAAMSVVLLLFPHWLSSYILDRPDLGWIFIVLAFSQWLVGVSNTLMAVLSTLKRVRIIVIVNSVGTIGATALFVFLLSHGSFEGAALGFVLYPAVTGFVSLIVWLTQLPAEWRRPIWRTQPSDIKQLLSYSFVMVVTVAAVPFGQIVVRDYLGEQQGWANVGYWQGVLKISDVYMQFMGLTLSYYALPRFSAHKVRDELQQEFLRILLPLIIIMTAGMTLLYALRDLAIHVLFSANFAPMRDFFLPQMIGDVLRVATSVFIFYGLSRGARLMPIIFEVTQAAGLIAFTRVLMPIFQQVTPAYAYMVTCGISLVMMMAMCQRGKKKWFA